MKINLTKPLAFFDLEATGLNIGSDRIVEICILKVHPDGSKETLSKRVNPQIAIPAEATAIHHITDEDVKDCPTFKELAKELSVFLENCDLAGYNSNKYDIPLLTEEFLRAEADFDLKSRKLIDVQNIFHFMEQRTLKAAYKFYCDKPLENAHNAEADVLATYEVFVSQLERYKDTYIEDAKGNKTKPIENDMAVLSELSNRTRNVDLAGRIVLNNEGVEVFNFGKHKDKSVIDVFKIEPSYYNWMMNGDFPLYTKKVITQIKLSLLNTKK